MSMNESTSWSGNMSKTQSKSIRGSCQSVATLIESSRGTIGQFIVVKVVRRRVLTQIATKVEAWSNFNSQVGSERNVT